MAADTGSISMMTEVLILLGAAVIAAPLFKRIGLGTVLGYLAAGIIIGPILQIITNAEEILHFAELGVVLLLFVIGLELKPSRLWALRRDIFGLGAAQVILTGGVLTVLIGAILGGWNTAFIIGFGLALSSTAFALQILEDNHDTNTAYGQKSFAILLLQDLAIVPLLALISVLAPISANAEEATSPWIAAAIAFSAVTALIIAGRYLLNPLFRIIANTGAREAMIAAVLLVVLGSAWLLQVAGLSMAMGAFIAGVLLAESSYRHELEADIEPFRGLLLGLFFIAIGLMLDLDVLAENWLLILCGAPLLMLIKSAVIYGLTRIFGSNHDDAVRIALVLPQGGEFGFVLFSAAATVGLMPLKTASLLIAIITITMALTPFSMALAKRLITSDDEEESMEEDFDGAGADVLMIGFSRFGQIASQVLLASGNNVTIIDKSPNRIDVAGKFGFRIYYGDGQRLDVLEAAGIRRAKLIAVCTHDPKITDKIVELVRSEFPTAKLYVRSYDRSHAIALRQIGVDYELRETFESGLVFGRETLRGLGIDDIQAQAIMDDIRKRDTERLEMQMLDGIEAGREKLHITPMTPEPLQAPKREGKIINEDAIKTEPAA